MGRKIISPSLSVLAKEPRGQSVLATRSWQRSKPLISFLSRNSSQAAAPTQLNSFFFFLVEAHLVSFPVLEQTIQGLSQEQFRV